MTVPFFYRPQSPCILRRSCILHSVFLQEPMQPRAHPASRGRRSRPVNAFAALAETGRPPIFPAPVKRPFPSQSINIMFSIILDYKRLSTFSTGFSTVLFLFYANAFHEFQKKLSNPQSTVLHMENLNFTLHNFFKFSIST